MGHNWRGRAGARICVSVHTLISGYLKIDYINKLQSIVYQLYSVSETKRNSYTVNYIVGEYMRLSSHGNDD